MNKLLILLFLGLRFTQVFALDIGEKLDVKILRVLPNKTVVISRGAEDYINFNEHIKLKIGDKFIARGIVVQVNMQLAYVKLYRIANPDYINTDRDYTLHSINTSEVPIYAEEEISNQQYYANLASDEQKIQMGILKNNSKLTSDLPPDMDGMHPDKYYRYTDRKLKSFETSEYEARKVSEALDSDNIYFSIYASPYQFERVNQNKIMNYGVAMGTKRNEKYELTFNFNQNVRSQKSQFDDEKSVLFSTNADLVFDINRITPNLTYFMIGSYYRVRNSSAGFGSIYPVKGQTRIGLTGLKYYILENGETIKKLDISYIPILERRVSEKISFDSVTFLPIITEETKNTIRHSLRLRLQAKLSEKSSITNTLFWRPLMDNGQLDFNDVDINNAFVLSYQLSQNAFLEYQNIYTNDIRLFQENKIEPINMINSFNFRYTIQ